MKSLRLLASFFSVFSLGCAEFGLVNRSQPEPSELAEQKDDNIPSNESEVSEALPPEPPLDDHKILKPGEVLALNSVGIGYEDGFSR